ncbi:MAG: hypothetical protein IPP46_16020 [Bacteroidetes bacterium]|nr:hypothetical protein [Bacteroidota bacterium]
MQFQKDSLESALLQIRNAVTYLELMQQVRKDQDNGSYKTPLIISECIHLFSGDECAAVWF